MEDDEHPLNTDNEDEDNEGQKPAEEKPAEEKPAEKHSPFEEKMMKPKRKVLWPTLTGIFAVLFVASLFTNGFNLGEGGVKSITGATAGELSAIIINDERCENCDITSLVENLKSVFPNMIINEIDYSTKEGKKLYEDNNLGFLPAVLLTQDIQNEAGYSQISNFIVPAGDYLALRIGAEFNPNEEICDNGIDDTGNNKVDCEDPYCKEKLTCRSEIPGKLDLFVMSQCPYGTMALNAMQEVLENFGDNVKFDVHYIANENDDGTFSSLHGQPEVDENIRQLCAKKYYGIDYKYMEYIWCRNKDINSPEWKNCAFQSEMATDKLESCAQGEEGKQLLREDIKIANALGLSASPTWLANNKYSFGGINAEMARQNICQYNPGMEGCDTTLSAAQADGGQC